MVIATALLAGYVAAAVTQSVQPLKADHRPVADVGNDHLGGVASSNGRHDGKRKTHSYTSCVKPEDLKSNPWQEGSKEKCTWTC